MADLEAMSVDELQRLGETVAQEIELRGKRAAVLRSLHAMARAHQMTLAQVLEGADPALLAARPRRRRRTAAPRAPLPPKYVHPSNRKLSWTGRGRTPAWVKLWASTGGSMSALENAAEKLAR